MSRADDTGGPARKLGQEQSMADLEQVLGDREQLTAHGQLAGSRLTDAISPAMVELYAEFYNHPRRTATTYIDDNIVVRVLQDILSAAETVQIGDGNGSNVLDGRVAFQKSAEDEFTAIERLPHRSATAFLSANQTAPGVACELFFLEAPPVAGV